MQKRAYRLLSMLMSCVMLVTFAVSVKASEFGIPEKGQWELEENFIESSQECLEKTVSDSDLEILLENKLDVSAADISSAEELTEEVLLEEMSEEVPAADVYGSAEASDPGLHDGVFPDPGFEDLGVNGYQNYDNWDIYWMAPLSNGGTREQQAEYIVSGDGNVHSGNYALRWAGKDWKGLAVQRMHLIPGEYDLSFYVRVLDGPLSVNYTITASNGNVIYESDNDQSTYVEEAGEWKQLVKRITIAEEDVYNVRLGLSDRGDDYAEALLDDFAIAPVQAEPPVPVVHDGVFPDPGFEDLGVNGYQNYDNWDIYWMAPLSNGGTREQQAEYIVSGDGNVHSGNYALRWAGKDWKGLAVQRMHLTLGTYQITFYAKVTDGPVSANFTISKAEDPENNVLYESDRDGITPVLEQSGEWIQVTHEITIAEEGIYRVRIGLSDRGDDYAEVLLDDFAMAPVSTDPGGEEEPGPQEPEPSVPVVQEGAYLDPGFEKLGSEGYQNYDNWDIYWMKPYSEGGKAEDHAPFIVSGDGNVHSGNYALRWAGKDWKGLAVQRMHLTPGEYDLSFYVKVLDGPLSVNYTITASNGNVVYESDNDQSTYVEEAGEWKQLVKRITIAEEDVYNVRVGLSDRGDDYAEALLDDFAIAPVSTDPGGEEEPGPQDPGGEEDPGPQEPEPSVPVVQEGAYLDPGFEKLGSEGYQNYDNWDIYWMKPYSEGGKAEDHAPFIVSGDENVHSGNYALRWAGKDWSGLAVQKMHLKPGEYELSFYTKVLDGPLSVNYTITASDNGVIYESDDDHTTYILEQGDWKQIVKKFTIADDDVYNVRVGLSDRGDDYAEALIDDFALILLSTDPVNPNPSLPVVHDGMFPDPGFESLGTEGYQNYDNWDIYWMVPFSNNGTAEQQSEYIVSGEGKVHSGNYALRWAGKGWSGLAVQRMHLAAGTYQITFYAKVTDGPVSANCTVARAVDPENNILYESDTSVGTPILEQNQDWVLVTHYFTVAEDGVYRVRIGFEDRDPNDPSGEVFLDDFLIVPSAGGAPTPAATFAAPASSGPWAHEGGFPDTSFEDLGTNGYQNYDNWDIYWIKPYSANGTAEEHAAYIVSGEGMVHTGNYALRWAGKDWAGLAVQRVHLAAGTYDLSLFVKILDGPLSVNYTITASDGTVIYESDSDRSTKVLNAGDWKKIAKSIIIKEDGIYNVRIGFSDRGDEYAEALIDDVVLTYLGQGILAAKTDDVSGVVFAGLLLFGFLSMTLLLKKHKFD